MAAESFLLLAKVSYAEDPPSARTFRWTHLTQNLTLAVGRWAGLSPSISGQSLGIFQGQSTLVCITGPATKMLQKLLLLSRIKANHSFVFSVSNISAINL